MGFFVIINDIEVIQLHFKHYVYVLLDLPMFIMVEALLDNHAYCVYYIKV